MITTLNRQKNFLNNKSSPPPLHIYNTIIKNNNLPHFLVIFGVDIYIFIKLSII